ncbi:MAG: hypothetical protein Tsb0016_26010 [Sphingomonadales bacterium]
MRRSKNWGFPRWGGYGRDTEPEAVRLCDHAGCREKAEYPAPKAPNSKERWWFCLDHVTAYNKSWDYFAGLSSAEAERLAREERQRASGDAKSNAWSWAADNDGYGATSLKRQALEALELDEMASQDDVKRAYRRLAKVYHPDINPGNAQAAQRFHEIRRAYDYLSGRD